TGLVLWAQVSYQGICQLAPTLFLGIFWRRTTALSAVLGMVLGFGTAAIVQIFYPISVPWLGGMTSGIAGLIVNTGVMVAVSLLIPNSANEQNRVDNLFDELNQDQKDEKQAS